VVSEAMNFGLPVVVSDAGGCAADLVAGGENGHRGLCNSHMHRRA